MKENLVTLLTVIVELVAHVTHATATNGETPIANIAVIPLNRIISMLEKLKVIIITMSLLFSFELISAQTKRALVIGIGKYPANSGWAKISGDKDVEYVKEYLQAAHFASIRTLSNDQATKSKIVAAFNKLKNDCKSGDVVYIHYSGHGQQMRDTNNDERDKLDECWIPYDACKAPCKKDRGEKHLTDDELNGLLLGIENKIGAKGKILVVADACHSGDCLRSGMDDETVRGVQEIFEAVVKYFKGTSKPFDAAQDKPNVSVVKGQEPWILLSACKSDQLNTEMGTPSVGKLTYGLHQILKNNNHLTNDKFCEMLSKFIDKNSSKSPQTLEVSGSLSKYNIFSVLK